MNYSEVIDKTYELIDTIKSSEIYINYLNYEDLVLHDDEVKKLLDTFNEIKTSFNDAYQYKAFYPDFNELKTKYQQAKIALMSNKLFKSFKLYEKQIENYLTEIEFRIKAVVNIKNKHGSINLR